MTRRQMMIALSLAGTLAACRGKAGTRDIEALVASFNSASGRNDVKRTVALFTSNGTYRTGNSQALPVAEALLRAAPKRLPWDERTALRMSIHNIDLVRPDVAIVDATQSDTSPMLGSTRTWSCVFVLVRAGSGWKISSYKESAPLNGIP